MKKNLFTTIVLAAGLAACTGDYTDWAPLGTTEPDALEQVTLQVERVASEIVMEQVTTDSVQVFVPVKVETSLPLDYELLLTNDNGKQTSLPTTAGGMVAKTDLVSAVEKLYGKRQQLREMDGLLKAYATLDGVEAQVKSNSFKVFVLPEIPPINYWIYGKQNNRDKTLRTLPLMPITPANQTVTTYFSGSLDTKVLTDDYFADPLDAYIYGVEGSQQQTWSGNVLAGNGGYISSPSAGWFTLSFDFANLTYKFTQLDNQQPAEYRQISLIGLGNDWSTDVVLTEVATNKSAWRSHCWYLLDLQVPDATKGKFRADADWAVNWGADQNVGLNAYGVGTQNGADISIPAGTFDVYFNDITGEFLFLQK
ncbi:MAG: DUF5115 domain-containing protein [Bacteroidaceae bacterium]|nr:DUF5115 domain-containing protein [Bacteroidaceae bacterium]